MDLAKVGLYLYSTWWTWTSGKEAPSCFCQVQTLVVAGKLM